MDQNPDNEIQTTLYRRHRRNFIKEYERTIEQGVLEDGTYLINLPNHALGGGRYYEPYFLFVKIGESLHAGQVLESSSLSPGTKCSPIRFYRSGRAQDSNRLGKVEVPEGCSLKFSWTAKGLLSFIARTPPTPDVVRIEGVLPRLFGDGTDISSEETKFPAISFFVDSVVYRYRLTQKKWPYLSPISNTGDDAARTVNIFVHNWKKDKRENEYITGMSKYMVPVKREVRSEIESMRLAVEILLSGRLTAREHQQGLSTGFPIEGFELAELDRNGDQVVVRFRDPLYKSCGGSLWTGILRGQIRKILLQFDAVKDVEIRPRNILQP